MRFCRAYGQSVKTEGSQTFTLFFGFRREGNAFCVVDLLTDRFQFFFNAKVQFIRKMEVVFFFTKRYNRFGKRRAAVFSLFPYLGKLGPEPRSPAFFL